MSRTFNQEAKVKLTQLINEGISVLQEVDTLNEENEANEELNTILQTVGKA